MKLVVAFIAVAVVSTALAEAKLEAFSEGPINGQASAMPGGRTDAPYDASKDTLYRNYLKATIAGVVVALVGLALVYRQGSIANKTAQTLANVERGWVLMSSIDPVSVNIPPGESNPVCTFVCYLKNFGKTPVRIVETAYRFHSVRSIESLPDDPFYGKTEEIQGDWFLAPGDFATVVTYLETRQLLPVLDAKAMAAHGRLHALGMIKYEDTFGRAFETRFSFVHD